jgi:hypothetical protein
MWRRWRQEIVYKRRICSDRISPYIGFQGNNQIKIRNPKWSDLIGSTRFYLYKSISTHKWDSRRKIKYSPNRSSGGRDFRICKDSVGTREGNKNLLLRIKNEYGI